MKLKTRIKLWSTVDAIDYYTAQYKMLGIWFNMTINNNGKLNHTGLVKCETFEEAKDRIYRFFRDMERAENWLDRCSTVVWESDKDNNCPRCGSNMSGDGSKSFCTNKDCYFISEI